ncbi:aminopeptidase N [Allopseudospirillum japonicum]|uniref:Aminopeptidase N n=1 Tax=Allopseudospirillum japonicum TaxID=64971 RepID=A0A1H6RB95_9GAMM|nr:aminopeptidase N [Allopseudospirillum japonicum]SEI48462.1 aminopeptidase N [Allopseudospirillum japonicum]
MSSSPAQAIYLRNYQAPEFALDAIDLTFELDPQATKVSAEIQVRALGENRCLVLDGQDLTLLSLAIDGRPLDADEYQYQNDQLTLLNVPSAFCLSTQVEINPQANSALEGLYLSNALYCTQCEAEGFRRISFFLDRPDVLSRFTTKLIADPQHAPILLANGNPIAQGTLADGRHWVQWQDPFPKPCYLFALVAGDLVCIQDTFVTQSGRSVDLQIWVEAENQHKCAHAMRSLKAAMRWDEEVYGREYDLDIYMIVAVNDFNMGAMENKGLNIFNSACALADPQTTTDLGFQRVESVIAHEYFHNWSGNRVTCRDWFQLSLKEGFTVYRDQAFSADMNFAGVQRIEEVTMLRSAQFAEDASPTAHPVRPDHYMEINNFYTLTVYEKGAEIVRMLANLLGPQAFRQACDLYFTRFDGQAVTVEDFVACMEEISQRDLSQFMRWYHQAGTPHVQVQGQYCPQTASYRLDFQQATPDTPGQTNKQPLLIPITMGLLDAQGRPLPLKLKLASGEIQALGLQGVLELTQAQQSFEFIGLEELTEAPIPSLLRGFSAPVKLSFPYTPTQLATLMAQDTDAFNRWDAGQRLALDTLMPLIDAQVTQIDLAQDAPMLLEAYRALLTEAEHTQDQAMLASMLRLPSFAYLAEQYACIPVEAIEQVRQAMRFALARTFYPQWKALYQAQISQQAYAPEATQIAQRSLKNLCLDYLLALAAVPEYQQEVYQIALTQWRTSDNMTDARAALTLLAHAPDASWGRDPLAEFAQRWQQDALTMDQWFSIQATRPYADTLQQVQNLLQHPNFSLKNPNKVRALIGAFAQQNPLAFHQISGAGYAWLADQVIELNGFNPQIAARLVIPLTRWQRYQDTRQTLMRAQLERIQAQANLSADVYEIVTKALQV